MTVAERQAWKNYLDTKAAAAYLGVTSKTLERWRWKGGGPEYFKVGARVMYRGDLLDEWLETRRRRSTSDAGGR